jgi:hypothetical protein
VAPDARPGRAAGAGTKACMHANSRASNEARLIKAQCMLYLCYCKTSITFIAIIIAAAIASGTMLTFRILLNTCARDPESALMTSFCMRIRSRVQIANNPSDAARAMVVTVVTVVVVTVETIISPFNSGATKALVYI